MVGDVALVSRIAAMSTGKGNGAVFTKYSAGIDAVGSKIGAAGADGSEGE